MPFNSIHFNLQFRLFIEAMARQHTLFLKCIEFTGVFTSNVMAKQHMLSKHSKIFLKKKTYRPNLSRGQLSENNKPRQKEDNGANNGLKCTPKVKKMVRNE